MFDNRDTVYGYSNDVEFLIDGWMKGFGELDNELKHGVGVTRILQGHHGGHRVGGHWRGHGPSHEGAGRRDEGI